MRGILEMDNDTNDINLRVAGRSDPSSVAGSTVKNLQEGKQVTLTAIGAGAVNQMLKSVTIARSMSASSGFDLYFTSGFATEVINGEEKTAMRIFVKKR
jgi:stage V sporulation protein S